MEELKNYIHDARRDGHSDEHIKNALVRAGWDASQVENALNGYGQPVPHAQPARHVNKKLLWGAAGLTVLIMVVAGLAWRSHKSHEQAVKNESLTLYYNDGKTVLWRDDDPAVEPAVQPPKASYFVDLVRAELHARLGSRYYQQGAWQVTTTLDAPLQTQAEKLIANNLNDVQTLTSGVADEEATVLEDVTTGQIKALVGGVDRSNADHGQVNYAVSKIAPGSSIQPFDYVDLLEHTNSGAGSAISDVVQPFPDMPCTNRAPTSQGGNCLTDADGLALGTMPLRYALGGKRTIPALAALYQAAPRDATSLKTGAVDQLTQLVQTMGATGGYRCFSDAAKTQQAQCYGSTALGEGAFLSLTDETHALSTLANNGQKLNQTTIISASVNGRPKLTWHAPTSQQVINPDTAFIVNDIMSDPQASYLRGACTETSCVPLSNGGYKFQRDSNGWHFAVDSGSVSDQSGAVMASWSSRYAVVSWVGNHAERAFNTVNAESLTAPLTRGLMEAAHANLPPARWPRPNDIQTLAAYVATQPMGVQVIPSPPSDIYPAKYRP